MTSKDRAELWYCCPKSISYLCSSMCATTLTACCVLWAEKRSTRPLCLAELIFTRVLVLLNWSTGNKHYNESSSKRIVRRYQFNCLSQWHIDTDSHRHWEQLSCRLYYWTWAWWCTHSLFIDRLWEVCLRVLHSSRGRIWHVLVIYCCYIWYVYGIGRCITAFYYQRWWLCGPTCQQCRL